ncbi:nickel-dependent lactate racemase family protein [[Eubacterium] cellulosolvens]
MEIELPYSEEIVKVTVPDVNVLGVIAPKSVPIEDERTTVYNAIKNPINSKPFHEFITDARDVLFIVNDATRPTPTAKVLDFLYDDIKGLNLKFIVATGTHRAPTDDELKFIFGPHLDDFRNKIMIHDAKNEDVMVHIGTTSRGTEVKINKIALDAHKIVIIGSTEPHYFSGYTGGRKAFIPGLASYQTIEHNHKHALEPAARTLALKGNPVHEDMEEGIKWLLDKEIFAINTVLDNDHNIYSASAGNILDSFYATIEKANNVFCVNVPTRADIVVSVAPHPMDIDLYQSQKALDNGKLALKEGGIIILVSKCRTGIGPNTFVMLMSSADTPQGTLDHIAQEYKVGYHKAAKLAEIAICSEMWAVTDLEDKILQDIFIAPYHDIQQAIDEALAKKGPGAKILFMPNGAITVPLVEE